MLDSNMGLPDDYCCFIFWARKSWTDWSYLFIWDFIAQSNGTGTEIKGDQLQDQWGKKNQSKNMLYRYSACELSCPLPVKIRPKHVSSAFKNCLHCILWHIWYSVALLTVYSSSYWMCQLPVLLVVSLYWMRQLPVLLAASAVLNAPDSRKAISWSTIS